MMTFSRLSQAVVMGGCFLLVFCLPASAADSKPSPAIKLNASDVSFQHEIQHAIDRGLAWLQSSQNPVGWWSTADHPAVTSLALTAFQGEPTGRWHKGDSETLKKGYAFVLGSVKPDGSIYRNGLINYNTAISMMALLLADRPEYDPILRKARAYLVASQIDLGEKGKLDTPFDGGVGYGSKYDHSDMNNTLVALEALYHSRRLVQDQPVANTKDLDWVAAIHFLQNCQNLPAYNKQTWATGDPDNKGGFVYHPKESKAGEVKLPSGQVALRSYGSISYAGLLSYIYADLKRDDPRVKAVRDWLRGHFSLEENPGMGAQGYYYYLHLMTKALNTAGVESLQLKDGRQVNWRREVAMRLINLQQKDGSWLNDDGRWWEKDPNLVTAYSVMALEIIFRGI